jgi:hypothetical protein
MNPIRMPAFTCIHEKFKLVEVVFESVTDFPNSELLDFTNLNGIRPPHSINIKGHD